MNSNKTDSPSATGEELYSHGINLRVSNQGSNMRKNSQLGLWKIDHYQQQKTHDLGRENQ